MRQPKTRRPKAKFAGSVVTCAKCKNRTHVYDLANVDGAAAFICSTKYGGCEATAATPSNTGGKA